MNEYTINILDIFKEEWEAIPDKTAWLQDKLRQDRLTTEYMKAVKSTNIKINKDGTVSPIDASKPSVYNPNDPTKD